MVSQDRSLRPPGTARFVPLPPFSSAESDCPPGSPSSLRPRSPGPSSRSPSRPVSYRWSGSWGTEPPGWSHRDGATGMEPETQARVQAAPPLPHIPPGPASLPCHVPPICFLPPMSPPLPAGGPHELRAHCTGASLGSRLLATYPVHPPYGSSSVCTPDHVTLCPRPVPGSPSPVGEARAPPPGARLTVPGLLALREGLTEPLSLSPLRPRPRRSAFISSGLCSGQPLST